MPKAHPAQAAKRGSLSARQWSDLRQAARLSCSEGVTLIWRGPNNITMSPSTCWTIQPGRGERSSTDAQNKLSGLLPYAGTVGTMDSETLPKSQTKSKSAKQKQRDVRRRLEYQANKLWVIFTWHLICIGRRNLRNNVWTEWMRGRIGVVTDAQKEPDHNQDIERMEAHTAQLEEQELQQAIAASLIREQGTDRTPVHRKEDQDTDLRKPRRGKAAK